MAQANLSAIFTEAPNPETGEGGKIKITKDNGEELILDTTMCLEILSATGGQPYTFKINYFTPSADNTRCLAISGLKFSRTYNSTKSPGNAGYVPKTSEYRIPVKDFRRIIGITGCPSIEGGRRKNRRKTKKLYRRRRHFSRKN